MILKETLKQIISEQKEDLEKIDSGIIRDNRDKINLDSSLANIITGIRRCGKSTLLKQLTNKIKEYYYFNFEDVRVTSFEVTDFRRLDEAFKEASGERDYYFFDEIQNVPKWEVFVRTKLDQNKKIIITGSNASLLSKELGTKLTGRHLNNELYPFSYSEYLKYIKQEANLKTVNEYLVKGGFPEYLKTDRIETLQELFNDIIIRDIAVRHGIRDVKSLKELAIYLTSNVSKEFSYNQLKKVFNLGSVNTAIKFVNYLEDSYLLFTVPLFSYSLKKQRVNPKKVYSIDTGLIKTNTGSFTDDIGRMLENAVFIHLKRLHKNIYYHKNKGECDFLVKEGNNIVKALQVCYELTEDNKDREINGLLSAMKIVGLNEGVIVTLNQSDEIINNDSTIKIIPAWKWLLNQA